VAEPDDLVVLYGRQPVRQALADERIAVDEVLVSRQARVDDIIQAAAARGVALRRVVPDKVTRVSGNGRHDQGVVAIVRLPSPPSLADGAGALDGPVLVLDGVTNPANVGMIVRSAAAFGVAVVLPDAGSPGIGPLVVKASAGVALFAPVLRAPTALDALRSLRKAGYAVVGLRADGPASLRDLSAQSKTAFVVGSETDGLSDAVAAELDQAVSIPIGGGVESLNAAVAAAIVCYELARRG
jgi:23S rRNA (guanosine2251-2'-O)-methyltransferase